MEDPAPDGAGYSGKVRKKDLKIINFAENDLQNSESGLY